MKEETCIILDFLPSGYSDRRKPEPIAQAIGTSFFSMLELIARENTTLMPEEEVYIGDGKRDKIRFIRGQLEFRDLTNMSRTLLPDVIEKLVARNEKKFIDFFNKASTITPRMHQFELLPGIGKKHLMDILDERRKKPFESFEDMKSRVKQFSDPAKAIVARIVSELEGNEKYYIFTPAPRRQY
jgi:putative nucleotide binding protein